MRSERQALIHIAKFLEEYPGAQVRDMRREVRAILADVQPEPAPVGVERVQRNGDFQTVYFTDGSQVYDSSTQDEHGRWRDGRGIDAVLRLAQLAGAITPPDIDVYRDGEAS